MKSPQVAAVPIPAVALGGLAASSARAARPVTQTLVFDAIFRLTSWTRRRPGRALGTPSSPQRGCAMRADVSLAPPGLRVPLRS